MMVRSAWTPNRTTSFLTELLEPIASRGERARLAELAAVRPEVCWDRLLFSAKESVYKAWFPLARRWLGFDEACITIDTAGGTFTSGSWSTGRS